MQEIRTLIREVREYGPDGNSVSKVEYYKVRIEWLDGKSPKPETSYYTAGNLILLEPERLNETG